MIWIVSGPTSVGKSTFLTDPRCAELTGLDETVRVLRASAVSVPGDVRRRNAFYHYNILRPLLLADRQAGRRTTGRALDQPVDFGLDASWMSVVAAGGAPRAIVLVAPKPVLLQRIRSRANPSAGDEGPGNASRPARRGGVARQRSYPGRKWTRQLERTDLPTLYRAWCQELSARAIPYVLVQSVHGYPLIDGGQGLADVLRGEPATAQAAGEPNAASG